MVAVWSRSLMAANGASARQNENFIASWRIRGSSALVIWPKVDVPNVVLTPDWPASKLGGEMPARKLLVMLKASARISNRYPSRIENSLESDMSNWKKLGPGMLLRPNGLSVPGAGSANAFGLIQQVGPGFAHSGFASIWTGRSVPAPGAPVTPSALSATSLDSSGVIQYAEEKR